MGEPYAITQEILVGSVARLLKVVDVAFLESDQIRIFERQVMHVACCCTPSAVCRALQSVKALCLPQEQLEEFRRTQADILDTVSSVYLQEQLNPDKIKATSAKDAANINGIAIEKSRLIKGESTQNLAVDIRALTASVIAISNVPSHSSYNSGDNAEE